MPYSPLQALLEYSSAAPFTVKLLASDPALPYSASNLPYVPDNVISLSYLQMDDGPFDAAPFGAYFTAHATFTYNGDAIPYYVYGWAIIDTNPLQPQLLFANKLRNVRAFFNKGETARLTISGWYEKQKRGN